MQNAVLGAGENATQLNQAAFQSLAAFQDITFPAATCLFPKQPTLILPFLLPLVLPTTLQDRVLPSLTR